MEEVLSWAIHLKTKAAFHLILKVVCLNSTSSLLSKEKILKAYRDQASLDLLQLLLRVMRWISQWRMVLPASLPSSRLTLTSTKSSINNSVFIFLTMVAHQVISLLEAMTLKSMQRKARKFCGLIKLRMRLTGLSTPRMSRWEISSFLRTTNRSFLIMV